MIVDPLWVLVAGLTLLTGVAVSSERRPDDGDGPVEPLSIFDGDSETPPFNVDDALAVADAARNGCGCLSCTQAADEFAAGDDLTRERLMHRRPQARRLARRLEHARWTRSDGRDGAS